MHRRIATLALSDIIFFLLSLVYLAAEFRFNVTLLDVAGSPVADSQAVHAVADFGRMVSASGFTLLSLGLFSAAGFRLVHLRQRLRYAGLAIVCLIPFVFFPPAAQEYLFVVPVLFGIFLMFVCRGRFPFHVILSIVLTAWPAMYAGQKAVIEHLVVNPSTWQEREYARNLLLLKSGLEDCIVELQGKWLCQGDKSTAEIRAVRAMIAALWMHRPAEIIAALESQRDAIVQKMVERTSGEKTGAAYKKYIEAAEAKRREIFDELITKFYTPYERASQAYARAQDPKSLQADIDRIWQEMDKDTDDAWTQYRGAQEQYQNTVGRFSDTMLDRDNLAFQKLDEFCASHNCPRLGGRADSASLRLIDEAETQFIRKTGFPPNLADKADMMTYPRARDAFEAKVNEKLVRETGIASMKLPPNWVYDERYMKALLTQMFQTKVAAEWKARFKDLPPGLPPAEFFTRMNIPPLPDIKSVVMSEQDFNKTFTVPAVRKKVDDAVAQMKREAPLYANGQILEDKGKDYVRAVYLPAIALLLSLMIVTLTIVRGFNGALRLGMNYAAERNAWLAGRGSHGQRHIRHAIVGLALLGVAFGPYAVPNDYTESKVYQVYLYGARQENMLTATLLDWAIHMQPVVYGLVKPLR